MLKFLFVFGLRLVFVSGTLEDECEIHTFMQVVRADYYDFSNSKSVKYIEVEKKINSDENKILKDRIMWNHKFVRPYTCRLTRFNKLAETNKNILVQLRDQFDKIRCYALNNCLSDGTWTIYYTTYKDYRNTDITKVSDVKQFLESLTTVPNETFMMQTSNSYIISFYDFIKQYNRILPNLIEVYFGFYRIERKCCPEGSINEDKSHVIVSSLIYDYIINIIRVKSIVYVPSFEIQAPVISIKVFEKDIFTTQVEGLKALISKTMPKDADEECNKLSILNDRILGLEEHFDILRAQYEKLSNIITQAVTVEIDKIRACIFLKRDTETLKDIIHLFRCTSDTIYPLLCALTEREIEKLKVHDSDKIIDDDETFMFFEVLVRDKRYFEWFNYLSSDKNNSLLAKEYFCDSYQFRNRLLPNCGSLLEGELENLTRTKEVPLAYENLNLTQKDREGLIKKYSDALRIKRHLTDKVDNYAPPTPTSKN